MIAINYYEFWDGDDFIFPNISKNILEYFSVDELDVLKKVGLPEWVAPHILIFEKFEDSDGYIFIGEDEKDRVIAVCKESKNIIILNNKKLFCNSSFSKFIETLYLYASVIDTAIKTNKYFSSDNGISTELMGSFKDELEKLDSIAVSKNSFWKQIIENNINKHLLKL